MNKVKKTKNFAQKLREIRAKKKITQLELSLKSGIHPNQISTIERDAQLPGLLVIIALCKALKVTPNDLIEVK